MSAKDSYTLPVDPVPTNKLLNRLQLRVINGLSIISIIIGIIATSHLYRIQSKQLETELFFQVEQQALIIDSEITRLRNIATQITSRSHIRQQLEKYLFNEISLDELEKFSIPILNDARHQATEIVGITRLDASGVPLIHVGTPIPVALWPENFLAEAVQLGLPQEINQQQFLVLSAPVINHQGEKSGIDLVAFKHHA